MKINDTTMAPGITLKVKLLINLFVISMFLSCMHAVSTEIKDDNNSETELKYNNYDLEGDTLESSDANSEDDNLIDDPLEDLNRFIFGFNQFIDKLILKPAAYAFQDLLSDDVQDGFRNFLGNLGEPLVFINDLLQGKPNLASESLARFIMNSTLGVLGIYDFAANHAGIQAHAQDLGITFGRWGVESGPYLVLPIFGPSTFRDAFGKGGDHYIDPYNIYMRNHHRKGWMWVRSGANGIVKRQSVLEITESMDQDEDPYAQYRSLYMQNRDYIIKEGLHDENADVPNDIE